ncbi:hypothetical protein VB735_02745 [Halotia wernerae UHCC 0503]|nr:hypothetical protein [Halotia wernerae UHCC 0503]
MRPYETSSMRNRARLRVSTGDCARRLNAGLRFPKRRIAARDAAPRGHRPRHTTG